MDAMETGVAIMALAMLPAVIGVTGGMILSYRKQALKLRMAGPDQQQMQALLETARRMEQRVDYLERVLDHEAPGWRNRSETV